MVTSAILLALTVVPAVASLRQSSVPDPRTRLIAAKAALYDSNFRNDRPGLSIAVESALAASSDESVRSIAFYYAAWGEWAASHSYLQAGDLEGAVASLTRSEQHARAGLALDRKSTC